MKNTLTRRFLVLKIRRDRVWSRLRKLDCFFVLFLLPFLPGSFSSSSSPFSPPYIVYVWEILDYFRNDRLRLESPTFCSCRCAHTRYQMGEMLGEFVAYYHTADVLLLRGILDPDVSADHRRILEETGYYAAEHAKTEERRRRRKVSWNAALIRRLNCLRFLIVRRTLWFVSNRLQPCLKNACMSCYVRNRTEFD